MIPPAPGPSESGSTRRDGLRAGALYLAAFILTRLAVLVAVGLFVHGREFTDDVPMHLRMARAPLAGLTGEAGQDSQHPPLLGLVEAILVRPLLLVTPEFYAIRLAYLAYEVLAAAVFWRLLVWVVPTARHRLWPAVALLVCPMGWVSTVVMAQDEILAALVLVLVIWLHLTHRPRAALAACGLGVVAAKIFLLVPLLVLFIAPGRTRPLQRLVWGGAPVAGVTGLALLMSLGHGGRVPLLGFAPAAEFGVNIWVPLARWLRLDGGTARLWSSMATAAAILALVLAARARRAPWDARTLIGLTASALLCVFALFYHVNPEYYLMVLPLLLLQFPAPAAASGVTLILALPWCVNLFFGLGKAADDPLGAKGPFLEFYSTTVGIDPAVLYGISLMLSVLGTSILTIASISRTLRAGPDVA